MSLEADIAWVAGVLDARAGFYFTNRRGVVQPRLNMTTNRLALITTLCQMTGVRIKRSGGLYQKRPCSQHCTKKHSHAVRQSSYWVVDCTRATIILHSCLPYLRSSRDDALALLEVGYPNYQPTKNGTAAAMERLGWKLPAKKDRRGAA